MAVRIRLARVGARHRPYYRIVVANEQSPRDGRFLELVGTYDPRADPPRVSVKQDRVKHWLEHGATATHTVSQILRKAPAEVVEPPAPVA